MKVWAKYLVPAAVCAAAIFVTMFILSHLTNYLDDGRSTDSGNLGSSLPTDPPMSNVMVINEVTDMTEPPMARPFIDWDLYELVHISEAEAVKFYGFNFIPDVVPADITRFEPEEDDVVEGFTGFSLIKCIDYNEIVEFGSSNWIWWTNADGSRSLHVGIDRGQQPFVCYIILDQPLAPSTINGVEIVIKHWFDQFLGCDWFRAKVTIDGNGLRISSQGLTEAEFIDVLISLLE